MQSLPIGRWFFVLGATAALLLPGSPLARAEGPRSRGLLSPARKPAGVPSDYVVTHNGFFHPSCVVTVASGDVVGGDGVVRGGDGSEHGRFAECAHPRFSLEGRALGVTSPVTQGATPGPDPHAPPLEAAAATYDGYIVWYSYNGALGLDTTLVTDWTVPLTPRTTADQDIAFFNDILTTAGGGDILQPVLDYNGEVANHWAIESEHCCISGNDMQTTPVDVNAGDAIRGTVTGAGCDATGACQSWSVTTADVTTGQSTTLNTTAPMGVPNGLSPGSLETYGVTGCDLFPASGDIVFTNNVATSGDGGVEKLTYRLTTLQGVAAEVPTTCGYGGTTSGNSFTLIYGAVDAGSGGETMDSGSGASSGGGMDAGSSGGGRDAGAPADARAPVDAAASDAAAHDDGGGSSSDASTSGGVIADASAGGAAHDSGTPGAEEASDAATNTNDGAGQAPTVGEAGAAGESGMGTGGCQCNTVAGGGGSGAGALAGVLSAALLLARGRRRSRERRIPLSRR